MTLRNMATPTVAYHDGVSSLTIDMFMFFRSTMTPAYEKFMANKKIQEIKQNKNYDIVIVDALSIT